MLPACDTYYNGAMFLLSHLVVHEQLRVNFLGAAFHVRHNLLDVGYFSGCLPTIHFLPLPIRTLNLECIIPYPFWPKNFGSNIPRSYF